jgi:Arc/MetJ family transcription regulator
VKHLVDLDEEALAAAQEHLGTATIKDTVNAALNLATGRTISGEEIEAALDVLAAVELSDEDREALWR